MQETPVQFLGQEDPLEEGMATHSSILAWEIPWTEEPGGLQSVGSQRVGHDWSNLARASAEDRGLIPGLGRLPAEPQAKDLHDPDNHNGVITHLEPDILKREVEWALGSITTNKLVEVMEFQQSYFKS